MTTKSKMGIVFTVIWILAIGWGMYAVETYAHTPAPAATPDSVWPAASHLKLAPDRPTLVLLAHPLCPCSRASLSELALLMAQCQGEVQTYALFVLPAGLTQDVMETELWRSAAVIPGVTVLVDRNGMEARAFHARTSGETMLYAPDGRLLFHGGITSARGHSGDNDGRSTILAMLRRQPTKLKQTPVFGCSLLGVGSDATPGAQR